ncbi:MAG: hypothetical protein ACRDAS_04705 [Cetobacterium sp.]
MKAYIRTKTPNGCENESGVEYQDERLGTLAIAGVLVTGIIITVIVCKNQNKVAMIKTGGEVVGKVIGLSSILGRKLIGS